MLRCFSAIILWLCLWLPAVAQWVPDTLGHGYMMRYVDQPDDYAGPVRCTVVRQLSHCRNARADVLYIHGYNDYFFQTQEGLEFADSCYNFYAVDLRKYGRSILPGQRKFQAREMREYFPDIDSAISIIRQAPGERPLVIMAHSTGGLIASLYMTLNPTAPVDALVLNSPFLEWNFNGFMRKVAIPAASLLRFVAPGMRLSQGSRSIYAESLLTDYHGRWQFNTEWKTVIPEKVETSWLHAITWAQKQLRGKHPKITIPILLMHSARSVKGDEWTPEFQRADAVLNVNDIARLGRELGTDVTEVSFDGGLHDLMLSDPEVTREVYQTVFTWLDHVLDND